MEDSSYHCPIPALSPHIFSVTSRDENTKLDSNNGQGQHVREMKLCR